MTEVELIKVIVKAAKLKAIHLDLSGRNIKVIPKEIAQLTNLSVLNLSDNQITEIPKEIAQLVNLSGLYLFNNQIIKIPKEIAQLTNLSVLDLSNNQIIEIPDAITQLVNLSELDLNINQITEIPKEIAQLVNLSVLDLDINQITEIPDVIAQLKNLSVLYLLNNQITEIPDAIAQLKNLSELYLSNNQITEIPDAIAQLINLSLLDLEMNQITEIPEAIAQLAKLTELQLEGNPIPIPVEILNDYANPQKILDYHFRQTHEELKPLNEGKLIVVGQGAVGKTALVSQLVDKCHVDKGKTDGIEIRRWKIKARDTQVQLNLWDFGGQEIMHATHQFFLTERSLYLLVLNNREDERANQLDRWLKIIQSFGKDSPILIIGNWADDHGMDLDQKGWQTKYSNIKGFFATSCKPQDAQGIEELRQAISDQIATMDSVFATLPQSYFDIKAQVEKLEQQGQEYIPYTDYEAICSQNKIDRQSEQRNLAQILHDLGIALNFADDYRLAIKDTYVLNPSWIVGGVYKILNDNLLMTKNKGILRKQDHPRVFNPKNNERDCYPTAKEHQFVIEMMTKFELCFALDHTQTYLIPDLLTKEEPDTGEWESPLRFELKYEVLPQSIMSRFIVKSHNLISKNTYWRTGVVLIQDGARAYIKADLDDGKIFIRIIGNPNTRRSLLSIIRNNFDAIHKTISALPVTERVPLPDNEKVTVSYQYLLELERDGDQEVRPEGASRRYNIRELLEGIEKPRDYHNTLMSDIKKSPISMTPTTRDQLFVSYSHQDSEYLKEFNVHFKPYIRDGNFNAWDDTKIKAGTKWRDEINKALLSAKVAVLLVSPHFIASEFIHNNELPQLLEAAEDKGLTIIWIPISTSAYKKTAIEKYQAAHPPSDPLDLLSQAQRNKAWNDICEQIEEAMKEP